jgi:uncharacterized membrane protein
LTSTVPGRALTALLVALVVVTAAGIVVNWPDDRELPSISTRPPTVAATVIAVSHARCATPGHTGCEKAIVRLQAGVDAHRVTVLDTIDPTLSGPVAAGDGVLVYRNPFPAGSRGPDGAPLGEYAFADFRRTGPLLWLLVAFVLTAAATGRTRGLRALIGLGLSLAMAVFFVVPAIAHGRPPLEVAAFGGLGVMLLTIPLVHGGGAKALAACVGTAVALLLTLVLADVFTRLAHLSGSTSDEAVYVQAVGAISLRGLLLAGMVIGALGVLADTTVTQASVVIALRRANPGLGFRALIAHASAVGRDHIAATVNTLVLAYTGAAIPVLLIFSFSDISLGAAVNSESVVEALVAMLVGSIGLMLAVPITTALAAWLALQLPPVA